jgi:hypothetical protein
MCLGKRGIGKTFNICIMLKLQSIRFLFFCRTTYYNAARDNPIVLRIIYRSERRDVFTGLYCKKEAWDSEARRVTSTNSQYKAINQTLDLIRHRAHTTYTELMMSAETFTVPALLIRMNEGEGRLMPLVDYLKEFDNKIRRRLNVDISQATYQK